jgi:hypothetical protein
MTANFIAIQNRPCREPKKWNADLIILLADDSLGGESAATPHTGDALYGPKGPWLLIQFEIVWALQQILQMPKTKSRR